MRRKLISVVLISIIFFSNSLTVSPVYAQTTSCAIWTIGSYVGWEQNRMPPNQIDFQAITHVMHFSVFPRADGTINWSDLTPEYARSAVTTTHNAGRKIGLFVGGLGSGNSFVEAARPENRARFVKNLVNLIEQYNYDGVSLDWEEQVVQNSANYQALVVDLRTELNRLTPRRFFTADVASILVPPSILAPVHSNLDSINIMSYWDYPRDIPMQQQVQTYVNRGIPITKLSGGVGLGDDGGYDTTPEKVRAKMDFIKQNKMKGALLWKIDDVYTGTQRNSIMDVFRQYVCPPNTSTTTPSPSAIFTPVNSPTYRPSAMPSKCLPLGDIDCSGKVNSLDLSMLINLLGSSNQSADLDNSGSVNSIDLSILISNIG